jgi:methionyl-tRNA synthetase
LKNIYITTTLPYANGKPHLGHLFELVLADILTKYHQNQGRSVFFNTGLDENGAKITKSAKEKYPDESTPFAVNEYQEDVSVYWHRFCAVWSIHFDSFYRTSHSDHKKKVKEIWDFLIKKGVITLQDYSGNYCEGCESFKTSQELKDGKCPDHPNLDIKEISEKNYFLSPSGIDPLTHLEIVPRKRVPEADNIIENYKGISVSRLHDPESNLIQSPDPEHDIYVWFDALLNYIFAVGYDLNEDGFREYWEDAQVVQICGQDNLKFQAVIWQDILSHLGLPLTDHLLVHGIIRDEKGQKLSKTLGNYIDPNEIAETYGVDAVRLYICAQLPTYSSSKWNNEDLINIYNSWVVNGFGNLARRVTTLLIKNNASHVLKKFDWSKVSEKTIKSIEVAKKKYKRAFDQFDYNGAALAIHELTTEGNREFNDSAPWNKEISDEERISLLTDFWAYVLVIKGLYEPIISDSIWKIEDQLRSWELGLTEPEPVKWFVKLETERHS